MQVVAKAGVFIQRWSGMEGWSRSLDAGSC